MPTVLLKVFKVNQADDTTEIKRAIEKARPVFASLPGVSLVGR